MSRYQAGETIDELAAAFDVSITPVRRALVEAGVPFRRRSWRPVPLELESEELVARYDAGESAASLARAAGVSVHTVHRRLREAGVTLRPKGRGNRRVSR